MEERRERYHAVNGQWPTEMPVLTGAEALAAAKRLYRFAMKRKWPGRWKLTSGRRYTWPRGRTFYVNPSRGATPGQVQGGMAGWRDLVHMLSHYCHRQLYPKHKPHGGEGTHHHLEREMVAYVIERGWLEGKLKAKPSRARPKPDADAKAEAAEQRWTRKLSRAQTALKKLARQRARYARQMASKAVAE